MPTFVSPTDDDRLKLEEGGGLSRGTLNARLLVFGHYINFVAENRGEHIEDFDLKSYYEEGHLTDADLLDIFKK